jgi:hypothetical protein
MVVYPKQYSQASVKASGSGDPPKPHIPVERERFINAKDNYTVNLKIVKNLLRNNSIDCNPYLEAVNFAPKGFLPRTLFDGVLTKRDCQLSLILRSLRLVLLLGSTKRFDNSKLVFLQRALFTGKNLLRPLYFLPPLLKAMYMEKVQRVRMVQKVVAGEKVVAKAAKVEVLRQILSQPRLIFFLHYLSYLRPVGIEEAWDSHTPLCMDYLLQVVFNPFGIPGFDANSYLQFQQFQANAAAGSAAQLESKPNLSFLTSVSSRIFRFFVLRMTTSFQWLSLCNFIQLSKRQVPLIWLLAPHTSGPRDVPRVGL